MRPLPPRLAVVMVDCRDAERLAAFWSRLLQVEVRGRWREYVGLHPATPGGPRMVFQQVAEPAPGQRLHVDLHVADLDATTDVVERLGGRRVRDVTVEDQVWRVLADPEGNVFCLVPETG